MKTIGLIGGLSWESTQEYYRIINETARERLGGLHSARSLIFSFDFAEIEILQHSGKWDEATKLMIAAAQDLQKGGADFVMICSNTMHKMAPEVQAAISIPLIHIAEPTGELIKDQGIKKIGLLGTRYTMEHDFYKGKLVDDFGLEVLVPDDSDRQIVNSIIYDELCLGIIKPESKKKYQKIIADLESQGAQGVILGCTEITLLIKQPDVSLPLFDTTRLHAEAAIKHALS